MAHKMGASSNPDETLRNAFQVFDSDGDGTISAKEIREVMWEMGECIDEGDIAGVMGDIDANGDGRVDYDEFAKVVTREMKDGGFALV
jgi:Ca2+-binding EF-hand superfamily protein